MLALAMKSFTDRVQKYLKISASTKKSRRKAALRFLNLIIFD